MKEHRWKYLKHAFVWLSFTAVLSMGVLFDWTNNDNWFEKICNFGLIILFSIFGLENLKCFFISQKTESKGEICYGKICSIIDSPKDNLDRYCSDSTNSFLSEVDVYFFLESEYEFKMLTTFVKVNMKDYTLGSYVKCKYYNNNITIEGLVQIDDIPKEIVTGLKNKELADYVVINGIEYVKKI